MTERRQWFTVNAEASSDSTEIYIHDYIGKSYWNDRAIDAMKLVNIIKKLRGQHIDLYIHSLGGDAFEGQAIHNVLKRHVGGSTAHIDGICYSAATFVACGCDEVIMPTNTLFGIHESWSWEVGNWHAMEHKMIGLQKCDETQVAVYAAKSGKTASEILAKMAEDIPMTAQEAYDYGLVDQIGDEVEADPIPKAQLAMAALYVPERFAAMLASGPNPLATGDDDDITDKLELVRGYAIAISDTIDDLLEEDEDTSGSDSSASLADTSCIVGEDVAALLTLTSRKES